jgi:hypothetical protein
MARRKAKELPATQPAEQTEAAHHAAVAEHLPDTSTDFNPAELERQHEHQQQAADPTAEGNGHHASRHTTHREHGQSHAHSVGKRQPRYNEQGITDKLAGAKLLEHHDPYLSIIRFEEKPSDAVREKLRDGGFKWVGENKEWVRPINFDTRGQDRIHADRVFGDVTKMTREERGIQHSYGTHG